MIRIGIVDDHTIIRTALQFELDTHVEFRVTATASNARDAVALAGAGGIDVLLMDLALPGVSGIEAIAQIRKIAPSVHILVYSAYPEDLYGTSLLNMGVRGYVSKDRDVTVLVNAIRIVAQGGVFASREAKLQAESTHDRGGEDAYELLSPREYEVFLKLARGARLIEVSRDIGITIKTASTYRSRILAKLRMTNNTEFTRYAMAHHLIT